MRYLFYFSYIGTNFRGVATQKKVLANGKVVHLENTVIGNIEKALKQVLRIEGDVCLFQSSRTDSGVHALRTTAHADLDVPKHFKKYSPCIFTMWLNKYFEENNTDIRIHSVQAVPNTFHARYSAKSRSYLYRIGVKKVPSEKFEPLPGWLLPKTYELPINELDRAHFIMNPEFDINKAKEAAKLFIGDKNFLGFMGKPTKRAEDLRTIRTLNSFDITVGAPFMPSDPLSELFTFWNITCTARSFLYRQVRRMVSAVIAHALGELSKEYIQDVLENPREVYEGDRRIYRHHTPPCGLYLTNVEYDPADLFLEEPEEEEERQKTEDEIWRERWMARLEEFRKHRAALRACETTVTTVTGEKFVEKRDESGEVKVTKLNESCAGFVVDSKPDMDVAEILPYLCLSSQDPAQDGSLLKAKGITHVLSIGVEVPPSCQSTGITYKFIELLDLPESDLTGVMDECWQFINEAKVEKQNNKVLVHCNAGYSRSPTVVVSYLIKNCGYSLTEALMLVKNKRDVRPNEGFLKQLKDIEVALKAQDSK